MQRVWLDTDIGSDVDDAVALLCALRHPGIELIGVSTVWGRVEIREWLAREMLARAGADSIPVLPGAMAPLIASQQGSEDMPSHGRLAPEMPALDPADDEARIEALAKAMISADGPFHLLTVGALTNIARLLDHHAGIVTQWSSVTCMAGRLEDDPEYNVACDPAAARDVMGALGPRLVGIEACSNTLTREEAETALDPSDPVSAFLLDCYREYRRHAGWHGDTERAPLTLFDPIALLSLVHPEAFDFQPLRVRVERGGRLRLSDDGSPVAYAASSDWDAIKPRIVKLLGNEPLPP